MGRRIPSALGWVVWVCASLIACAEPAPNEEPQEPDPEPDPQVTPSADETLLRDLIAGPPPTAKQVEDALSLVASRDGWPVATVSDTFLFARVDSGPAWNLSGDFNGWADTSLTVHGALQWTEQAIPAPNHSQYKFHDGQDSWVADPWARRYHYDEYGEISLVAETAAHLERWQFPNQLSLRGREVRVWVPTHATFDRMLLAHDGQNLFDPDAPWGGWHLPDSLPPRILVVGIDNTEDRMDEYTHVPDDIGGGADVGGAGDAYAALVHDTIQPWIEQQYGAAPIRGLMGSSLGGLISLHIAQRFPGEYDFVACLSGTLGWGRIGRANETMIERYEAAGHASTPIYLDSGGSGVCWDGDGDGIQDDDPNAEDNYCETVQMRDTLNNVGYTFNVDLWHWHEPDAEHNEAAWAARVWRPLQLFADL